MNSISIVTPSLNQGQFIEQTIKSVLDQSGDFYIDYIIADGGSTDGSIEIINKYDRLIKEQQYPIKCRGIKFRWWSESDEGQTQALNKGFKMAEGEICAWINSDDYYTSGALAKIIRAFSENPEINLVYGNVTHVYENGEIRPGEAGPRDFKKNLEEGCQISQQGAFFTRKALEQVGYLDESFQYCMDYDLWLKILKYGKAKFIPDNLAYYRFWSGSKTGLQKGRFKEEENRIRKKHGGSLINPGAIHRWRYNRLWTEKIKRKFPRLFNFAKKIIYKTVNLFRFKHE